MWCFVGVKVAVDFSADWCRPCKKMAPIYSSLAENHRNVLFVSVDVDKNEDLTGRFPDETSSIPSFLFIYNGKPQDGLSVAGASDKKLRESAAALAKL
jgi:thioredoxin 1